MQKTCAKCGQRKSADRFYRQSARTDGLHPWCKDCCRSYDREWITRPGHRERRNSQARASGVRNYDSSRRRERIYGLDPAEAAALLEAQGGRCAICRADEPGGRWNAWHADHDHACCPRFKKGCGKCVRGFLCQNCNILMGHAKDDPKVLIQALLYLGVQIQGSIAWYGGPS